MKNSYQHHTSRDKFLGIRIKFRSNLYVTNTRLTESNSFMSANVVLNLSNQLTKNVKMRGFDLFVYRNDSLTS